MSLINLSIYPHTHKLIERNLYQLLNILAEAYNRTHAVVLKRRNTSATINLSK